jgi:uncharacterized pyridoxamine 5'-phosphate oxidase family protein
MTWGKRGWFMSDDGVETWVRRELGNDEETWRWALSHLKKNTMIALATQGADGPRVRPVTVVPFGDQVDVLTSTGDSKIEQLEADPRFEFYVLVKEEAGTGYVRFSGRVEMVREPGLRREVGDEAGFVDSYWKGPDDPNLTVLRMGIGAAEVVRPGVTGWEMLTR